jgi:hypothetical protein
MTTNLLQAVPPLPEAREIMRQIMCEVEKSIPRSLSSKKRGSWLWREWKKRLIARLGTPLRIKQAEWRAFSAAYSRSSLPPEIEVEIELRYLILARELSVDIDAMDCDWRDVTAHRATLRLLTGNGGRHRAFPPWLLGDGHTNERRPFPDNGALRVVRPSRRRRFYTDEQLDEAEAALKKARKTGTNLTEALLPLAQQMGGRRKAPRLAKLLREAVRNRDRGRRSV